MFFYFLLDQKVTKKSSQQKGFLAAPGLCPANQAKPRAAKHLPYFVRSKPALRKHCYALSAHMPTIVLPDFARSGSADLKTIFVDNKKLCGGLTEKRAGRMA